MLVVELPLNLLVILVESFTDGIPCEGLDCLLSNEVKDTLLLLFRTSDEDFIVAVYVSLVDVLNDFLSISESELSSMSVTFGISKMLSVLVKVEEAFLPDDVDRAFDNGIGDVVIVL